MEPHLEQLKKLLNEEDRFCRYNGIQVETIRPGSAEAVMEVCEESLNGLGAVQGGAIFTLADLALAAAANSRGSKAVTQNSTISYLRPGSGRKLRAVATEVSRGRRPDCTRWRCAARTGSWLRRSCPAYLFPKSGSIFFRRRRRRLERPFPKREGRFTEKGESPNENGTAQRRRGGRPASGRLLLLTNTQTNRTGGRGGRRTPPGCLLRGEQK